MTFVWDHANDPLMLICVGALVYTAVGSLVDHWRAGRRRNGKQAQR